MVFNEQLVWRANSFPPRPHAKWKVFANYSFEFLFSKQWQHSWELWKSSFQQSSGYNQQILIHCASPVQSCFASPTSLQWAVLYGLVGPELSSTAAGEWDVVVRTTPNPYRSEYCFEANTSRPSTNFINQCHPLYCFMIFSAQPRTFVLIFTLSFPRLTQSCDIVFCKFALFKLFPLCNMKSGHHIFQWHKVRAIIQHVHARPAIFISTCLSAAAATENKNKVIW